MSNSIQHKLLELEVPPPAGLWQKLEEELNHASGDQPWRSALYPLEVDAPASAWPVIASSLEPPIEHDLSSTLREASVPPPSAIWNEIEKKLDQPSSPRFNWKRYAAAAVMAGILFCSAYFLSSPKNDKLAGIKKPMVSPERSPAATNDLPVITQQQLDDRALEQSRQTYASVEPDRKKISRIASGYEFSSSNDIIGDEITEEGLPNDRYVVLMTPDGNFIRVSKKLGDLVCCVSGEEEDPTCKEQVGKWQKQLAAAELSHSGDFGDILRLVSALQQEK